MKLSDAVGEQLAEAGVGKTVDNELGHDMQVGARVDAMRDARADDREDRGGAFAPEIACGKKPVLPSQNERSQFPFNTVVGQLDPTIREEQDQSIPLPMQVADGFAERCFRRNERALLVDPEAQIGKDGSAVLVASAQPLLGTFAQQTRQALDSEQTTDHA